MNQGNQSTKILNHAAKIALCSADLLNNTPVQNFFWDHLLNEIPGMIPIDAEIMRKPGDFTMNARRYIQDQHSDVTIIIQNATDIEAIDPTRYTIMVLLDDLRSQGQSSEKQIQNLRIAQKRVTNTRRTAIFYPEYPFEVIPMGADGDAFHPMPKNKIRRELGLGSGIIGIYVGDFTERDGWPRIESCIYYYSDITWLLVCKEDTNFYAPNVKIYRQISEELLAKLYNCADFFITGKEIGGSSCIAALEACLCNIPVIMNNTTGIFCDFTPPERAKIGIFDTDPVQAITQIGQRALIPRETILAKKLTIHETINQWKLLLAKLIIEMERKSWTQR